MSGESTGAVYLEWRHAHGDVSFAGELEAHGGCGVKYGMSIVPPPFAHVAPNS